jgi:hypothetical protein
VSHFRGAVQKRPLLAKVGSYFEVSVDIDPTEAEITARVFKGLDAVK